MNIEQITGACGAEISGVNLARLSNSEFDSIHTALLDHGVLFFRDQDISLDEQVAFAGRFGPLEVHPIVDGMNENPKITKVLKPPAKAPRSAPVGTRIIRFLKNPAWDRCSMARPFRPLAVNAVRQSISCL